MGIVIVGEGEAKAPLRCILHMRRADYQSAVTRPLKY